MGRWIALLYGVVCYGLFFAVFLYMLGFNSDWLVPVTVSGPARLAAGTALIIDIALIALFGVQHSVMARRGFKRWITSWLSPAVERSTYVLATTVVLVVIFAFWQPVAGGVWSVQSPPLRTALWSINALGWGMVLLATFLTNHFDLFGLRQVWLNVQRRSYSPVPFREWLFYRWLRHPMMTGLLVAFWVLPTMSVSHLLFSAGMTLYIFVGVHFEEAGLRAELGEPYRQYSARTWRFAPFV